MSKVKTLGQIFTPKKIVSDMLDHVGYTTDNLSISTKTIFEPSFGEGVFLLEIIDRLLVVCQHSSVFDSVVTEILNNNIHGVELDNELYDQTLKTLTAHVESQGFVSPSWDNLHNQDALTFVPEVKFDYVVGNPPYVRTHNFTEDMKAYVVKNFPLSADGTPDLYVTFIEYGLSVLKQDGRMCYITPNSWLKNTSQLPLRKHLFSKRLLEAVYDYRSTKVFSNAGTYTSVMVFSDSNENIRYSQLEDSVWVESSVPVAELSDGETWLFQSPENQKLLRENRAKAVKFGDICVIQNALMTMRNSFYLSADGLVEDELLFDVVKASTFRGVVGEKILFPYRVEGSVVTAYAEDELLSLFPKAHAYLEANKEDLLARKSDKNALWFQYGRSQGVALLPVKRKISFRQHVSEKQTTLDAHILDEKTMVYAGMFIMEKEGSGYSLEDLKKIMESEEFCSLMKLTGKDMSGGYKELYSKHLKAFGVK